MVILPHVEVFQSGYYTKTGRNYTHADIFKMIEDVDVVPVGLEFTPTVLDGHLGSAKNFRVEDGKIFADIEIPAWADKVIKDPVFAIGCDLGRDRETMKIIGVSIVKNRAEPTAEEK